MKRLLALALLGISVMANASDTKPGLERIGKPMLNGQRLPFSSAVRAGDTVYLSGALGIGPDGKLVDGVEAQARLAMENLGVALKSAGLGWGDVAKCTVMLDDMADWPADSVMDVNGRTVYFWVMPSNVHGTWTVTAPAGGANRTYELRLEQKYQRVTGSATSGGRAVSVEGARVLGDSVMFTLIGDGATRPEEQRIRFAGRLNADTMTGAVTGAAAGNAGQWRASRRPNR